MHAPNQVSIAADLGIEELARECVRIHRRLYSVSEVLEIERDGHTLIVRGEVPTYHLKQLLQEALRELRGVERIDNQVEVTSMK